MCASLKTQEYDGVPATPFITLRPATPDDLAFLATLYASTRADELALAGFPPNQRDAFCQMQFNAQQQHYRNYFGHAVDSLILCEGVPIGRELIARTNNEIFLVDIALLPPHRNLGIGTARVRALIDESEQRGLPIQLYAEKMTRAYLLYGREGFVFTGEEGLYWKMARQPKSAKAVTAG
jgi:GNAT superfamily N-acetyltransferase